MIRKKFPEYTSEGTWEIAGCRKRIGRLRNIIYQHLKSAKKRLVSKPSEKIVIEAF